MADPGVRVRALLAAGTLVLLTWGAVALFGHRGCDVFSQREARELAGLPVPPACVQSIVPPQNAGIDPFGNVIPGATP
jgi:hypothetical protein